MSAQLHKPKHRGHLDHLSSTVSQGSFVGSESWTSNTTHNDWKFYIAMLKQPNFLSCLAFWWGGKDISWMCKIRIYKIIRSFKRNDCKQNLFRLFTNKSFSIRRCHFPGHLSLRVKSRPASLPKRHFQRHAYEIHPQIWHVCRPRAPCHLLVVWEFESLCLRSLLDRSDNQSRTPVRGKSRLDFTRLKSLRLCLL